MSDSFKRCYIVGTPINSRDNKEIVIGWGDPEEPLVEAFDRILGKGDEWEELYSDVRIVHGLVYKSTLPNRQKYIMPKGQKSWTVKINRTES